MRRFMTTLVTAAALLVTAGPMMAQGTPLTEERTQPGADSHGPTDGLTIHGTVEEFDGDQLTLRTETGVQHIQIIPETAFPGDLEPGTEVAVDYNRTTSGVMIANQIRLGGAGVDVGMESTTTTATVETREQDGNLEADLVTTTEPETTRDFDTDTTRDFDTRAEATTADELPSTGSDLPLIALLGLIGLAGAGALHVLRS